MLRLVRSLQDPPRGPAYLLPRPDRGLVSQVGGDPRALVQSREDVFTEKGDHVGREGLDKIPVHVGETAVSGLGSIPDASTRLLAADLGWPPGHSFKLDAAKLDAARRSVI